MLLDRLFFTLGSLDTKSTAVTNIEKRAFGVTGDKKKAIHRRISRTCLFKKAHVIQHKCV